MTTTSPDAARAVTLLRLTDPVPPPSGDAVTPAQLTAALAALPQRLHGDLADLPADGAVPDGSTYFAEDQWGGTPYEMMSGAWVQTAPGITQELGIIAGPVFLPLANQVDVKAIGNVPTDIGGMSLNVPANDGPVLLKAKFEVQFTTGTAAANATCRLVIAITDAANVALDSSISQAQQGSAAASLTDTDKVVLEAFLPGPVAGGVYKVRTWLVANAPANWGTAVILPGNTLAGVQDHFYALGLAA